MRSGAYAPANSVSANHSAASASCRGCILLRCRWMEHKLSGGLRSAPLHSVPSHRFLRHRSAITCLRRAPSLLRTSFVSSFSLGRGNKFSSSLARASVPVAEGGHAPVQLTLPSTSLNQKPNPSFRLNESLRMRHNHSIHLLVRHRRLIQAHIQPPGINLPGNLLNLHPMPGTRQQVHYGFFEFHC